MNQEARREVRHVHGARDLGVDAGNLAARELVGHRAHRGDALGPRARLDLAD